MAGGGGYRAVVVCMIEEGSEGVRVRVREEMKFGKAMEMETPDKPPNWGIFMVSMTRPSYKTNVILGSFFNFI